MFPNRDNCDQSGTNLRIFLEKRDIFHKIVQAGHEGPNRDNPAQIGTLDLFAFVEQGCCCRTVGIGVLLLFYIETILLSAQVLHCVTKCHKSLMLLQSVTKCYKSVECCYKVLQSVTKVSNDVTKCHNSIKCCYKVLQSVKSCYEM